MQEDKNFELSSSCLPPFASTPGIPDPSLSGCVYPRTKLQQAQKIGKRKGNLLNASFRTVTVSSGYTFLSSHILKILSMDLETEGSLQAREKRLDELVQEPKEMAVFSPQERFHLRTEIHITLRFCQGSRLKQEDLISNIQKEKKCPTQRL